MSAEDEVSKLLAGAVDSRGALPNVKQGKICDMVKEWTAATDKPFISFEYFPPKTEEGVKKLHKQIEIMAGQKPLFMDFTWGAGGSTSGTWFWSSGFCRRRPARRACRRAAPTSSSA